MNNVLEYIEKTVKEVPDKIAYGNESHELTFQEVYNALRSIGSFILSKGITKESVVIFMKKSPETIAAFFGCIASGCYYVPIDEEMPSFRVELILKALDCHLMICDATTEAKANSFVSDGLFNGDIVRYSDIAKETPNAEALKSVRDKAIDTDPIYIVFTSGSTGVPKGVVACHRSVIDYIETLSEALEFDRDTVFANQTPFYFDACLKEIYPTVKFGASAYIVPKELFMFPVRLVEFLNNKKINTVCWVVSALTMISSYATFDTVKPLYLNNIAFGSEVFPIKQFNIWKNTLPNCRFTNLYGPTETTGMCCYYRVNRDFELDEAIPIGRPFRNTEIILLKEDNTRVTEANEEGEICVRGTSLTLGYYKAFDKTGEVFVQNPLNNLYPELIYRTGDIGKYNSRGELVFVSRKDYQIKHMGHRIELGEIDINANMHEGVRSSCSIYDSSKSKIVLFYCGDVSKAELTAFLRERLPRYMLPNKIEQLQSMPLTPNGKMDRGKLKDILLGNR